MQQDRILLDHGSGGTASKQLIEELFLKYLDDPVLSSLQDCAVIDNQAGRLAFSTDSYVVDPLFFPGGDIGSLAVHGTVNDLAMGGARPIGLSLALILEEGLLFETLERVVASVARCSKECGVPVLTGDTKVVPKGKGDLVFINTSGIGMVKEGVDLSPTKVRDGDVVILSGGMGDHGVTIMTRRAGIELKGALRSDSAPLHMMVSSLLNGLPAGTVHCLRDPTRGGVATTLNEIAESCGLAIIVEEDDVPIHPEVASGCEILGLDPFHLANEGKCLAIVDGAVGERALEIIRQAPHGEEAEIIGTVASGERGGRVILNTGIGGRRIVTSLHGNPLPRIC
ncbi:MAG: hydrogenase expression/formation protein HypE [Thermodesulfobacteriota bacterium]